MFDFDIRDQKNTRAMSLRPEPAEDFVSMDEIPNRPMVLRPVFTGDKFKELVSYPVIVEGWEKSKYGRVRRAWHKEFTQEERNKIARYHGKFYRWYLVTGNPHRVSLRLTTLTLLQRAVAFFATV